MYGADKKKVRFKIYKKKFRVQFSVYEFILFMRMLWGLKVEGVSALWE